jgi:hypothetical protein
LSCSVLQEVFVRRAEGFVRRHENDSKSAP